MAEWKPKVRRVAGNEQEQMRKVAALLRDRRFDDAESELASVLRDNPKSFAANLGMGRLLQSQRAFDRSVEYLEKARRADPARSEGPYYAGVSYLSLGEAAKAIEAFQAAIVADPKGAHAYAGMAQAYFRENKLDESKRNAEEALKRAPDMVRPRILLARVYSRSGKDAEAQAILKDMLQANPDQDSAIVSLAMLYRSNDQLDDAISLLEATLERRDDEVTLWSLLGRLRLEAKDYAGAEVALRKAMELQPREVTTVLPLIKSLIAQEKVDEAGSIMDNLPRNVRERGLVHRLNGEIAAARKDYPRAVEHYRAALLRHKQGEALISELDAKAGPDGKGADAQALAALYRKALDETKRETRQNSGGPTGVRRAFKAVMRRRGRGGAASPSSMG